MTWRDQLRPASFRGVPFHVSDSDTEIGRRVQVHEYPLRNVPYVEDLGRRTRRFALDAYVLGENYMDARDALIVALETPGPGELIHHYLGALNVVLVDSRGPRESTRSGGMAVFTLSFVEAGSASFPIQRPDTPGVVAQAVTALRATAIDDFAQEFAVTGQPQFVHDAAESRLDAFNGALTSLRNQVNAVSQPLVDFTRSLEVFQSEVTALLATPETLGNRIDALLDELTDTALLPEQAYDQMRSLFGFGDTAPGVPLDTPSREQQAANQAKIHALIKHAAITQAALAASTIDYATRDDAERARDELLDQLDARLGESLSDVLYQSLQDLQSAVANDLRERGARLPVIKRITPRATQPALAVAHAVHGDWQRADEIIARNNIAHPGFVPGGRVLEVVDD